MLKGCNSQLFTLLYFTKQSAQNNQYQKHCINNKWCYFTNKIINKYALELRAKKDKLNRKFEIQKHRHNVAIEHANLIDATELNKGVDHRERYQHFN